MGNFKDGTTVVVTINSIKNADQVKLQVPFHRHSLRNIPLGVRNSFYPEVSGAWCPYDGVTRAPPGRRPRPAHHRLPRLAGVRGRLEGPGCYQGSVQ